MFIGPNRNTSLPVYLGDPVARHSLNDGLRAWYLTLPGWDGGRYFYDLLGLTPGTLSGVAWGTSVRPGGFGRLGFDGSASSVSAAGTNPTSGLTAFTLSFWIYQSDSTRTEFPISTRASGGNSGIGFLFEQAAGGLGGPEVFFLNGGSLSRKQWAADLSPGWHHIAGTHVAGSNALSLYVDGISGGTTSESAATDPQDSGVPLTLGRDGTNTPGWFQGSLDDVRIYDRALSADAVAALRRESMVGYPETLNRFGPATGAISSFLGNPGAGTLGAAAGSASVAFGVVTTIPAVTVDLTAASVAGRTDLGVTAGGEMDVTVTLGAAAVGLSGGFGGGGGGLVLLPGMIGLG